jgi:hypothetical protein
MARQPASQLARPDTSHGVVCAHLPLQEAGHLQGFLLRPLACQRLCACTQAVLPLRLKFLVKCLHT